MDREQYETYRKMTDLREPYRYVDPPPHATKDIWAPGMVACQAILIGTHCHASSVSGDAEPLQSGWHVHRVQSVWSGFRGKLQIRVDNNRRGCGRMHEAASKALELSRGGARVKIVVLQDTCPVSGQHEEVPGARAARGAPHCIHQLQVWRPRRAAADRGPLPHSGACAGRQCHLSRVSFLCLWLWLWLWR